MHATTANTPVPHQGVVLRHTLADGSAHFDWMFEDPAQPPGTGKLVTFRADIAPADLPADATLYIDALAAHRRAYLDYEGPVSGDRGRVERIERFSFTAAEWSNDHALIQLHPHPLRLDRVKADRWSARRLVG